jgi:hypothetical protein
MPAVNPFPDAKIKTYGTPKVVRFQQILIGKRTTAPFGSG